MSLLKKIVLCAAAGASVGEATKEITVGLGKKSNQFLCRGIGKKAALVTAGLLAPQFGQSFAPGMPGNAAGPVTLAKPIAAAPWKVPLLHRGPGPINPFKVPAFAPQDHVHRCHPLFGTRGDSEISGDGGKSEFLSDDDLWQEVRDDYEASLWSYRRLGDPDVTGDRNDMLPVDGPQPYITKLVDAEKKGSLLARMKKAVVKAVRVIREKGENAFGKDAKKVDEELEKLVEKFFDTPAYCEGEGCLL